MKHLFVINPRSFPVKLDQYRVIKEIIDSFAALNDGKYNSSTDYEILISRYPRNAIGLIRKWINEYQSGEVVRVHAIGGDGILFDCLNGIVGLPDTELSSIPYGTSNDMVRAFGEDKKRLFKDIKLQITSPAIPTDIIHCGNNYAINFCTVGLESSTIMKSIDIYNGVSKGIKKFKKINSFIYAMLFYLGGIMAVFNKKNLNQYYTITIDGEDFSGVYGTINIANGPCYGGDKNAVITAMPDDGVLDALFFNCPSSYRTASIIPRYVKGEFRKFPGNFKWKRLKKIEIHSDDPLLVDLDGEVFFDTNLKVEIIPKAIKFTAPGGIGYFNRAPTDG